MTEPADLHAVMLRATGGHPIRRGPNPPAAVDPWRNRLARHFGNAVAGVADFTEAVSELLDALDDIEDDDGRQVWLTADEEALNAWIERVVRARDSVREKLTPREK